LLAAIVLVALAVSLLLAFASVTLPHLGANGDAAGRTTVEERFSARPRTTTAEKPLAATAADGADAHQPPLLWALLAPWAFAADAVAVLGLAAVLVVRSNARRRRGARR
jgi:hypothetical protein